MSGGRITQGDVARRAGVSTATVSYVLNGRGNRRGPVPAETQERVRRAMRELGYQRNHAARSLRRKRTELVCVVYRPPNNPWVERLTEQLHEAALARGYSVVELPIGRDDRAEPALRVLREHYVDGAIITPDHLVSATDLAALAAGGMAIVAFDEDAAPDGFDVVRQHKREACRAAVDHLVDSGHRRIAHLAQRDELADPQSSVRYRSYLDVLAARGIPVDESLVVAGADSRAEAYAATAELLDLPDPPTALFSATDRAAIHAIWSARDLGVAVPDGLAVVGVGNTGEGEVIRPHLTTVGMSDFDLTASVDRLYERIDTRGLPGAEFTRPWELIRRDSA